MYSNLQKQHTKWRGVVNTVTFKSLEISTNYSHITTFVHVISFLRRRSLPRTGHEVPEGE
jgi:hypothetical protein